MPYHIWGSPWFEANEDKLNKAIHYISDRCREQGICIHCKEKYGTVRWEWTCVWFIGQEMIHHYFYPGHLFIRWGKFVHFHWAEVLIRKFDRLVTRIAEWLGIVKYLNDRDINFFFDTVENACRIWPEVAAEITDDLDFAFDHPRATELVKRYEKFGTDDIMEDPDEEEVLPGK